MGPLGSGARLQHNPDGNGTEGSSGRVVGKPEVIGGPRGQVLVSRQIGNMEASTHLGGNRVNRDFRSKLPADQRKHSKRKSQRR
jgi:hypothetical protein